MMSENVFNVSQEHRGKNVCTCIQICLPFYFVTHQMQIYWPFLLIGAVLPVQDGLQVQDDLSLMVGDAGLPFLFLLRHEIPRRHTDLSTHRRPPPRRAARTEGRARTLTSRSHTTHTHTRMRRCYLMHTQVNETSNPPTVSSDMQLS